MIPFVDLNRQYLSIKSEMDDAIQSVINETAFIGGQRISEFENSFAQWLGTKHCIGCANGTDSIEILLNAMEVGTGDEVIVPAISWISTSEAVSSVGATPVFVDIHKDTYTIDISKLEKAITKDTKVIIPVHLYGQPADMMGILKIAEKHNLKVLEDCAQAHGAKINGQRVGTFGDAASFSFYPGKNLGAYGDAGGMVTNNDGIAKIARRIANHGQEGKHSTGIAISP
jgi:dTDP-4-amino-4,6-dideoxygalactose transaminase